MDRIVKEYDDSRDRHSDKNHDAYSYMLMRRKHLGEGKYGEFEDFSGADMKKMLDKHLGRTPSSEKEVQLALGQQYAENPYKRKRNET